MTRELEQYAREVLAVLQGVHQTPNDEGLPNYFKFHWKEYVLTNFTCIYIAWTEELIIIPCTATEALAVCDNICVLFI